MAKTRARRRAQPMRRGPGTDFAVRHSAITKALDLTRGDLRAVQKFSRHADVRTIRKYDDNRTDLGGQVAALVAGAAALETFE